MQTDRPRIPPAITVAAMCALAVWAFVTVRLEMLP
jgi:hypothetical protein